MITSLPIAQLKTYIGTQLNNFFPDGVSFSGSDVDSAISLALERLEYCFKQIAVPGYSILEDDGKKKQAFFSHMHSDQYSQFLYYLVNSLWGISQNKAICDKLICLNKALNGIFFTYNAKLPDIFVFMHPVGTILGNAQYSNFLVVLQNVTVNTEKDENGNRAPILGKGLYLSSGSQIIGNKSIGDRVSIGANTTVHNLAIPDDSVVFRNQNGELQIKKAIKDCYAQNYFNVTIC